MTGLDVLPLGRVINDAKVTDHHAIIPTNSEHKLDKLSDDDRRVYDMVTRRFLAVFHPDAVFENTRLETTVLEHIFRTSGRVLLEAGWRGVYGELEERSGDSDDEADNQSLPKLAQGENVSRPEGRLGGEDHPAAAALLRRLAARRDGDRGQARRRRRAARGDEGLRDRHAGHARGDHRAADRRRLRRARRALAGLHREGPGRDPPARRPRADVAVADGRLGAPAVADRAGRGGAPALHGRHRPVRRRDGHHAGREAQGHPHPAGQPRPMPGLRPRHRREPQGLLLLGRARIRAAAS